jgi:hypothetical protein
LPNVGTRPLSPVTNVENIAISRPSIGIAVLSEIILSGFLTPPRYISVKSLALSRFALAYIAQKQKEDGKLEGFHQKAGRNPQTSAPPRSTPGPTWT